MRKPRVIQEGAIYHVVAKVNRGEFIFETDILKNEEKEKGTLKQLEISFFEDFKGV